GESRDCLVVSVVRGIRNTKHDPAVEAERRAWATVKRCITAAKSPAVADMAPRKTASRWAKADGWAAADDDRTSTSRSPPQCQEGASAARRKRTIAHLPKQTRTALGKQAAKTAKR